MSELGDLLELLYGAHRSFRSARGTLREWRDSELTQAAMQRQMEREQRRGRGGRQLLTAVAARAGGEPEPPSEIETRVEFWLERPDRVRVEHSSTHPHGQNGVVGVAVGERWWRYDPSWGAMSNEEEPEVGSGVGQQFDELLDPVELLAGQELAIVGPARAAGREAIEVRATQRPVASPTVHQIPWGADEYRYLVDRERGVLLRRALVLEEREFAVTEVVEIVFDEEFPEGTFVLELPPGETFGSPGLHRPMHNLTLAEAAERASFPVWAIPRLPEGSWRTMVVYVAPSARPPIAEAVAVNYIRDDAQAHLSLSQSPAASAEPPVPGAERVDRAGNAYEVVAGEHGPFGPPTTVFFERGGTSLRLSSQDVPLEQLLDLADSLTTV